jgi:hypothetical protein
MRLAQTQNSKKNGKKSKSPRKSKSVSPPSSPFKLQLDFSILKSANKTNNEFDLSLEKSSPIESSSQAPVNKSTHFQPQNLKNFKKRASYNKIGIYDNVEAVDTYLRSTNEYPIITTNNNPNNCTLCNYNDDKHKMQAKYLKCSCSKDSCNLKYVMRRCFNETECHLYQSGIHADPETTIVQEVENDEGVTIRPTKKKPKARYGIALHVKSILTSWLEKDDLITPRRLLLKLINRRKKNMSLKKGDENRNEKYCFSSFMLPTLLQVFI